MEGVQVALISLTLKIEILKMKITKMVAVKTGAGIGKGFVGFIKVVFSFRGLTYLLFLLALASFFARLKIVEGVIFNVLFSSFLIAFYTFVSALLLFRYVLNKKMFELDKFGGISKRKYLTIFSMCVIVLTGILMFINPISKVLPVRLVISESLYLGIALSILFFVVAVFNLGFYRMSKLGVV